MELLIGVLVVCADWSVVASLRIAADLQRRGFPVRTLWLRLLILEYLGEYRRVTKQETGRVGPLFYHYVVPLNVALVAVVLIVLLGRTWTALPTGAALDVATARTCGVGLVRPPCTTRRVDRDAVGERAPASGGGFSLRYARSFTLLAGDRIPKRAAPAGRSGAMAQEPQPASCRGS